MASGTSRKTELKPTSVARASLEELLLDYEDFLRQRGLPQWLPDHPALKRFKARCCATLAEVRAWVGEEKRHGRSRTDRDFHREGISGEQESAIASASPCSSTLSRPAEILPPSSVLVANAALSP